MPISTFGFVASCLISAQVAKYELLSGLLVMMYHVYGMPCLPKASIPASNTGAPFTRVFSYPSSNGMDTKPCDVTRNGRAAEEPIELDTATFKVFAVFHADCGTSTVKEVVVNEVGVSVEPKPLTTVSDVKFVPVIVTEIDHVLLTIAIGGESRVMAGAVPDDVEAVIVTVTGLLHTDPASCNDPAHAVIFAEPALTPVTTPLVLTIAFALFEEYEKFTPEIAVPPEVYAVAVTVIVLPTTTVFVAALTVTVATTGDPPLGLDGVAKLQPASTSINATIENSFVFIVTSSGGVGY